MDHVDILFRICRHEDASPDWLATDAHIERRVVTQVVQDLMSAGLIIERDGVYRVTDQPRDRAAVEMLAEAYNARPVTWCGRCTRERRP
jgi:hypothetical protein